MPMRVGLPSHPYSFLIEKRGDLTVAQDGSGRIRFSGSDASTVIQSAINALTSGGKIFIKNAPYNVRQLNINKDNIVLEAEEGTVFNVIDDSISPSTYTAYSANPSNTFSLSTAPVIIINGEKIAVRGITINDTGQNRGFNRDGIFIWNSKRVLVDRCSVLNAAGSAIRVRSGGTYDLSNPDASSLLTEDIVIQNCLVKDTKYYSGPPEIKGFGYEIEFSQNVIVQNNKAQNCGESSFRPSYARSVRFLNNHIYEWTKGEAFDIYRSDDVTIRGNRVSSASNVPGVYIYEWTRNILVENNEFETASGYTIRLLAIEGYRDKPMENIRIINNWIPYIVALQNAYMKNILIQGNTIGNYVWNNPIETPVLIDNIQVDGNVFTRTDGYTVYVFGGSSIILRNNKFFNRVYAKNASSLIIENNEFTSNGVTYATGIFLAGSVAYARIANNYFHDITNQAIYATIETGCTINTKVEILNNKFKTIYTAASPSHAIYWDDNIVSEAIIDGNIFEDTKGPRCISIGNSAGRVQNNVVDKPIYATVATIKLNKGFVTENSGTATFSGNGSTTTFTIAHGLVGTPKSWRVEAGSADAKGDKYVTAGASNLYVTFATAPPAGTNNVVLVWQAEM